MSTSVRAYFCSAILHVKQQGIQQVRDCTITIQIDNCPIASKATQMGPMPVHVIALYVGPMP